MALRQLAEGDCGGVNPLMQLGNQFTQDIAHKDDGLMDYSAAPKHDQQMVNEFLNQVNVIPETFHMNKILSGLREMNINNESQIPNAPHQGEEVANQWTNELFRTQSNAPPINMLPVPLNAPDMRFWQMQTQLQNQQRSQEFFGTDNDSKFYPPMNQFMNMQYHPPQMAAIMPISELEAQASEFFDTQQTKTASAVQPQRIGLDNWLDDYELNKAKHKQTTSIFNESFWHHLQDEWQKLADENEHPWLSEYNETLDNYKSYNFAEDNPMADVESPFEKGKEYLKRGDIPSAVLCFEIAAQKEPENAEIWELLGMSQAENEMDPQSIAALTRALELQPDNRKVLMAIAVCYTNEGLQSSAFNILTKWLQVHPNYKHLIEKYPELVDDSYNNSNFASSLINSKRLTALQDMFLEAVRLNPTVVDPDIQEALGVIYNLSGEFDKAVDCFRAALSVEPYNAKLWNRLGASLANGARSVEAVEAYKQALELEPGFIRVRYNVGVCCMNLKAYKEAVQHFLTALNLQARMAAINDLPNVKIAAANAGQQLMSESIWTTLKMIISLMGRNDLHEFVNERNLIKLNEVFADTD